MTCSVFWKRTCPYFDQSKSELLNAQAGAGDMWPSPDVGHRCGSNSFSSDHGNEERIKWFTAKALMYFGSRLCRNCEPVTLQNREFWLSPKKTESYWSITDTRSTSSETTSPWFGKVTDSSHDHPIFQVSLGCVSHPLFLASDWPLPTATRFFSHRIPAGSANL